MPPTDAIARFIEAVAGSLRDGSFVRLTLSHPVKPESAPRKILARLVTIKGGAHLSLTFRHATRDVTKNLPVADAPSWVREQMGAHFRSALLGTTQRDWQLSVPASGRARLVAHKPAATAAPPRAHDQSRQTVLDESARDWLEGLGVVDATGKVRAAIETADACGDKDTADLFTEISRQVDKDVWFLEAHLHDRS